MNVVTLKVDCQKISNQEQFQNKPEKVNFSNYISTTKKKNQNNSRNFRIIGHPGTMCMELHAPPPPSYVLHPPTKVSLQLFKKFYDLPPPPPP